MFWNPSQPLEQWMIKDLLETIDVKARGIRVGKTGKCYADFESEEIMEAVKKLDGESVGDVVITVSAVPPRDDSQRNNFNKHDQGRRGGYREGGSYKERKENMERRDGRRDGGYDRSGKRDGGRRKYENDGQRGEREEGGFRRFDRDGKKDGFRRHDRFENDSKKAEEKTEGGYTRKYAPDRKREEEAKPEEKPQTQVVEKKEEKPQTVNDKTEERSQRGERRYGEQHDRRGRNGKSDKRSIFQHSKAPIDWDDVRKVSHPVEQVQPTTTHIEHKEEAAEEDEWQEVGAPKQKGNKKGKGKH